MPRRWRLLLDGPAAGTWNMGVDEALLALSAQPLAWLQDVTSSNVNGSDDVFAGGGAVRRRLPRPESKYLRARARITTDGPNLRQRERGGS